MKRIHPQIIGLVFFFFLLLSLFDCSFFNDKISVKNNEINKEDTPDLVLFDFMTSAYNGNRLDWILKSQKADVYEVKSITELEKIRFESYHPGKKISSWAVAQRGMIDNNTRNFTLLDQVTIVNSDKTVVTGDYFFWDYRKRQFTSTNRVTIKKKDGSLISGIGFSADQSLGDIKFEQQVSGELSGEEKVGNQNFFDGF